MLTLNLRCPHLNQLFAQSWATLPPQQRAVLERRCILVLDDPYFLDQPALGAVWQVAYRKAIFVLYLNPALPQQPAQPAKRTVRCLLRSIVRACRREARLGRK